MRASGGAPAAIGGHSVTPDRPQPISPIDNPTTDGPDEGMEPATEEAEPLICNPCRDVTERTQEVTIPRRERRERSRYLAVPRVPVALKWKSTVLAPTFLTGRGVGTAFVGGK